MNAFPILVLLSFIAVVRSQFFGDFFQGLQFVTERPSRQYEQTTKRTQYYDETTTKKNWINRRQPNRQTNRYEQTTRKYDDGRRNEFQYNIEGENQKKTTEANYYTTNKPRSKNSSQRLVNSNNRDQNTQTDYNNYDGKVNVIGDYYTENPNRNENKYSNYYTTHNPLINRPGVRPAVVDDRPPITNRPVTRKPNFGVDPRPKDEDAITFPDDSPGPEIITGPDEDNMSEAEKRRYIELSERMCDKYKSLTMKQLQAIPLLPSPEPVEVNVTSCTPSKVPLVVGGKVVAIEEFPHMALLGWQKIQGAGYSWKCGGSLVSDQFVLTAAHCANQERDNTVVSGPPRAVQLGSSFLDDPGALVVRVAAVIRHPKYKLPRSYYDLALVKLVNSVRFSEVIRPACLGVPPAVGKPIIATGWGRTEFGGEQSLELRSVSLPVWGLQQCREVLGSSRRLPDGPLASSQLCAGDAKGGKDTCQGDSGGPAQLQEGCIWRVVAVTSLGRSCGAPETPGLYALVHRAFVASQVFGNNDNSNYNKQNINYNNNNNNNNVNYENNNQNSNNNKQDNYSNNPSSNVNYGNNGQQNQGVQRPVNNYGNDNYDSQNFGRPGNNNAGRPDNNYSTQRPSGPSNNFNYLGTWQNNNNTPRPSRNYNYNNNYYTDNDQNNAQDYNNNANRRTQNTNYGNNNDNNRGVSNDYGSNSRYNSDYENYTARKPFWLNK